MLFIPTNSGMGPVFQLVVPVATPPDTAVSQRTTVTPTLSVAVPVMVMVEAEVVVEVFEGERIAILGEVVSAPPLPPPPGGGEGGGSAFTVI